MPALVSNQKLYGPSTAGTSLFIVVVLGLLPMSIHLYTPLWEHEVRESMSEAAGVEFSGRNSGLIHVGESEVNFTIEPTVRYCPCSLNSPIGKDGRCKVNFFGYRPHEHETSLQKTMRLNEEVACVIRSVVDALCPLRTVYYAD